MLFKRNNKQTYSCAKINQFQGFKFLPQKRKTHSSQKNPIKIVVQKMGQNGQLTQQISSIANQQECIFPQPLLKTHQPTINKSNNYKKYLTSRATKYEPKPFMFDRYNYENNVNYQYKNPYRPNRFGVEDFVMKKKAKAGIGKGSNKNLEIIFCQSKYPEFVKKTNERIQNIYKTDKINVSEKQALLETRRSLHESMGSSIYNQPTQSITFSKQFKKGNSQSQSKNIIKVKPRRSTLSNYLQEFNTLQKLSMFYERDSKMSEKCFSEQINVDHSKTVLLDIITHRFTFLKTLNRSIRERLYKTILSKNYLNPYTKINLHDYIHFIEIFVCRDISKQKLSSFIFKFLFGIDKWQFDFHLTCKLIDQINGPANKKNLIFEAIQDIFWKIGQREEDENLDEKMFMEICNSELLMNTIVDLILCNK